MGDVLGRKQRIKNSDWIGTFGKIEQLVSKKELMNEGKTVQEIGKQLGMRPEEIFRLSEFSKEDFLRMMIKPNEGYSKAEFITKI